MAPDPKNNLFLSEQGCIERGLFSLSCCSFSAFNWLSVLFYSKNITNSTLRLPQLCLTNKAWMNGDGFFFLEDDVTLTLAWIWNINKLVAEWCLMEEHSTEDSCHNVHVITQVSCSSPGYHRGALSVCNCVDKSLLVFSLTWLMPQAIKTLLMNVLPI